MNALTIAVLQWDTYNKRMQKVLTEISDNTFHQPIVPDGNSPSWILGHLVDTDDRLLELFGIRARLYPELSTIYHHERGTNQQGHLSKTELIDRWKNITDALNAAFHTWSEGEWLQRHTAVSEEDFKKEPHRNRLNVMLSRVTHKASHLGQVAMAKGASEE